MITVIIPYKEPREYLQDALSSVTNQNVYHEILHGGGGSLGHNVNKLVKKANGEFIKVLADDDILLSGIEHLAIELGRNNTSGFACGDVINFRDGIDLSKYKARISSLDENLQRNEIHSMSTLYRKSLWEDYGMWDEGLATAEEYDWHLMLLSKGVKFSVVNVDVAKYRHWKGSKSQQLTRNIDRIKYIYEIRNRYR